MAYPNIVLLWDPVHLGLRCHAFKEDMTKIQPQDTEIFDHRNQVWWVVVGHGKSSLEAYMDAKWYFCMYLECRPVWGDEKDPVQKAQKRCAARKFLQEYPVIIQKLYECTRGDGLDGLVLDSPPVSDRGSLDHKASTCSLHPEDAEPSVKGIPLNPEEGDEVFLDHYDYEKRPEVHVLNDSFVSEVEVVINGDAASHTLLGDEVWENVMDNALHNFDIDLELQ